MQGLRELVRAAYSQAAMEPQGEHVFPVGREFALGAGYPAETLARLPAESVEAFAGVSAVAMFARIPEGASVLDLGCGAGLDTLIAAERAGTVVGVDFSEAMTARAGRAAAGFRNVLVCRGDAERLPLGDGSIDVAMVNGIFNLNPARGAIFGELARVVRKGGLLYGAELILTEPLPEEQKNAANWFA